MNKEIIAYFFIISLRLGTDSKFIVQWTIVVLTKTIGMNTFVLCLYEKRQLFVWHFNCDVIQWTSLSDGWRGSVAMPGDQTASLINYGTLLRKWIYLMSFDSSKSSVVTDYLDGAHKTIRWNKWGLKWATR